MDLDDIIDPDQENSLSSNQLKEINWPETELFEIESGTDQEINMEGLYFSSLA